MPSFFIKHVRGWRVVALAAVSIAYGVLILMVLPFWGRMVEAQGGVELQTRFSYTHTAARSALYALKAEAPRDALIFYALDVPNALLYGSAMAAMIAFGLRRLHWEDTPLKWLILTPFLSSAADIAENACLAYAVMHKPAQLRYMLAGMALITTAKFATGIAAQGLAILATFTGLVLYGLRVLTGRSFAPGKRTRRRREPRESYSDTRPWS
ncbi:MAG: hypothetical protein JNJ73_17195 [Hyphomonadaceae bacterium]|nr:hypothetical protein [Hyphomonadaceae bacterium]